MTLSMDSVIVDANHEENEVLLITNIESTDRNHLIIMVGTFEELHANCYSLTESALQCMRCTIYSLKSILYLYHD